MNFKFLSSLRFRFLLASTVVEVLMLGLLLANSVRLINEAMLSSADHAVQQVVPMLNVIAGTNIVTGDLATLQDNLNAIVGKGEKGLTYVVIVDLDGERVLAGDVKAEAIPQAHNDLSAALSEPVVHIARPITLGGQTVGVMRFGLSTAVIASARAALLRQGAMIAAVEIVLTFVLLFLLGYWLTYQLLAFVDGSKAVAEGRFDRLLPVKGRDEVAQLAKNFNRMTVAVRERIDALAQSEAEFRALFAQAAVGIAHFSLDYRVIRANAKLGEILAFDHNAIADLTWPQLAGEGREGGAWPSVLATCEELRKGARISIESEALWQRHDGTRCAVRTTVSLYRDADGEPMYFIAVVQDIRAEKAAQAEIAHYRQHLEDLVAARTADLAVANRELEAFSYSVSHDLRAPVRTIGSFASILRGDAGKQLDDEGRDFLDRIARAATRMAHMIDALLELSRVSRAELRRETCDLSAIAADMCDELRQVKTGENVECVIEPGLSVVADSRLIALVLQNLLGNAWKFSARQPQAKIEFGRLPDAACPTFFVRDNGVGFDGSHAARLFAPFQRLHAEGEFEGTGIGLATVQRIVQRHGGRVWAEGIPGKGAVFYLEIPPEKA